VAAYAWTRRHDLIYGGNSAMSARSDFRERLVEGPLLKAIWTLSFPIMITSGLHSLFNVVDIYFVGKLGPAAVAGVGMSGVVMFIVMTLMIGLGTATRATVSRFVGSGDYPKAVEYAVASLVIATFLSIIAGIFGTTLAPKILSALDAKGEALELGVRYIRIMFLGMIGMAFSMSINGILQGAGDSKTPMYIMLFSVGLNVILDPMMILGIWPFPKWGVEGAAIATVSARGMAMTIGLFVMFRGVDSFKVPFSSLKLHWKRIWDIIRIGIPAAIQPALGNVANLLMIKVVAGFGTEAIAALVLAIRIHMFALLPGFGLGNANGAIVGQNLGAGKIDRATKSVWITAGLLEAILLVIGTVFYIFAPWIITQFNAEPEVVRIGSKGLRLLALGYPLVALATTLVRAINGAGKTLVPAIVLLIAFFGIQIPAAYLLAKTQLGASGVFIAISVGFAFQAIILLGYFTTGRWAKGKFH